MLEMRDKEVAEPFHSLKKSLLNLRSKKQIVLSPQFLLVVLPRPFYRLKVRTWSKRKMLSLHRYTIPTLRFRKTAPTTFIDSFISTSHDAK